MKCPFCIKKCTKCGELLVAYEGNFRRQKGGKWGLYASCKRCVKQYNKQYYERTKNK